MLEILPYGLTAARKRVWSGKPSDALLMALLVNHSTDHDSNPVRGAYREKIEAVLFDPPGANARPRKAKPAQSPAPVEAPRRVLVAPPPVAQKVVHEAPPAAPRTRDMLVIASDPAVVPDASVEAVEEPAERLTIETAPRPLTGQVIMEIVAAEAGLTVADIKSASRNTAIVRARQRAMYEMAKHTYLSSSYIGYLIHRDHSTVLHGIETHARRNGLPAPRGMGSASEARP